MIPVWISKILTTDELDLQQRLKRVSLPMMKAVKTILAYFRTVTEALLNLFDRNMQRAVKQIEAVSEDYLMQNWTSRDGEKIFFQLPCLIEVRNMAQNHNVHHRAQLGVYLCLLDIPLSTVYGSSADFKV
jgi:hypothetical protein